MRPLDPPRGSEFWLPIDPRFTHAIDLVKYIKSNPEFADFFCVGVAGQFCDFSSEFELPLLKG